MLSPLYTALLVLIVAGSAWAAGPIAIVLSPLIGLLALLIALTRHIWEALLYFVAILVGIALMLPAVSCAREAARRAQCMNNVKQIALGLLNYHEKYQSFPPAYVADMDGKPMHNWRVLILPFIEEQELYDKYEFDEPWDGPNNRKLLGNRPMAFGCPSDERVRGGRTVYTNYFAVVGPNCAWQCAKPKKKYDVGLGDSTVLLVESTGSDVFWTEPRDLTTGAVSRANAGLAVSSSHERYAVDYFHLPLPMAHAAMVNGSVKEIPVALGAGSPLLQVGGCTDEAIKRIRLERINWPHCVGLPIWLVSVGLLLHRAVRTKRRRALRVAENG